MEGRVGGGKQFLMFLVLGCVPVLYSLGVEDPDDATGVPCPDGNTFLRKKKFPARAASRFWALAMFSSTYMYVSWNLECMEIISTRLGNRNIEV